MLLFAESHRLAAGRLFGSRHGRNQPLFVIPPAAILRGGALSGTSYPNGRRHEDTTITTDSFSFELRVCHPLRPRYAALRIPGRRMPASRDALSLRPLRLTEPEPDVAWRAYISSPGLTAGTGVSAHR